MGDSIWKRGVAEWASLRLLIEVLTILSDEPLERRLQPLMDLYEARFGDVDTGCHEDGVWRGYARPEMMREFMRLV